MKTNKIITLLIATALIATSGFTSVSAQFGGGQGGGNKMTDEQKTEMQSMTDEEREAYKAERQAEKSGTGENKPETAGQGNQMTDEEKAEVQSMTDEEKEAYKAERQAERAGVNKEMKEGYKKTFATKYGEAFSKMSDEQINSLVDKIEAFEDKVENGDYTDEVKEKYLSILEALKELSLENLGE